MVVVFGLIFPVVSHSLVSEAREKALENSLHLSLLVQGWVRASLKLSLFSQLVLPGVAQGGGLERVCSPGLALGPWLSPTAVHTVTLPLGIVESFLPQVTLWPRDFPVCQIMGILPGTLLSHEKTELSWVLTHFACLPYTHTNKLEARHKLLFR